MSGELGLSSEAEAVYRAMLTHHEDGVAALATRLRLEERSVRDALDELSRLAMLQPSADRPGRMRAVAPGVGLRVLTARRQRELAEMECRVRASQEAAARMIAEYTASSAAAVGTEILTGTDEVCDRLRELFSGARNEVTALAPGGAGAGAPLTTSLTFNEDVLRRGVRVRAVYLDSARHHDPKSRHVEGLIDLGVEVRTAPAFATRMLVVDRSTALLPLHADADADGAVLLTGRGPLTALCELVDTIWSQSRPWGEQPVPGRTGCTPREAAVLTILADGGTDDTVAQKLGVSPRTARRLAATLMERLGARSRFQAGVIAAQEGLVLGYAPAKPPEKDGLSALVSPASTTSADRPRPGHHPRVLRASVRRPARPLAPSDSAPKQGSRD